jgi:RNA polymerase primary sigma factor
MNKHLRDLLRSTVEARIDKLTPRQQTVIRMRFGLNGGEPASLRDIGDHLGISFQAVHQIENTALKRMKERS